MIFSQQTLDCNLLLVFIWAHNCIFFFFYLLLTVCHIIICCKIVVSLAFFFKPILVKLRPKCIGNMEVEPPITLACHKFDPLF